MPKLAMPNTLELTPGEFGRFQRLVRETCGINLTENKQALLRARVGKIVRQGGFASYGAYYRHVTEDKSGQALQRLVDAISTNKTEFFREADHFDFLREERVFKQGTVPRIWCAGCATGEEAYTLAMTMAEREVSPQRADILATDVSTRALATARAAIYPEARIDGLPRARLRRFFLRGEGDFEGLYKLKPPVTSQVRFRHHNLLRPLVGEASFDVIFCRNVLIYFDRELQAWLIDELKGWLRPGGLLFLGHAECLAGLARDFSTLAPSVHRVRGP